jgi:hypothetical protein
MGGEAGRRILLDRGHGPQQWIRVSQRGILLGVGYYLPDAHPA